MGKWRKILLAIDENAPDRRVLQFSLNLCRGIRAQLNILQVVKNQKQETPPVSAPHESGGLETSGIASDMFLTETEYYIPESGYDGVLNSVLVKPGDPKQEIVRYIDSHREVVIAVDDTLADTPLHTGSIPKGDASFRWKQDITVPVVTVRKNKLQEIKQQLYREDNSMSKLFSGIKKALAKENTVKNAGTQASPPVNMGDAHMAGKKADNRSKLVVLGRNSGFSPKIMGYALEMAQRMNYEIIALNTAPLTGTALSLPDREKGLCDDFKCLSRKNAELFKAEAEKKNIPFLHKVKYVNTDAALEEVNMELGEIGFIVSEPEKRGGAGKSSPDRDHRDPGILVYSLH